jgi:mannose-6-phosphate isomerase-like protein (cupin superfamily)
MLKVSITDVGGEVVHDTDVYTVKDNNHLKDLTVSSTMLRAKQMTSGHSHEGQEEVYHFTKGRGSMQIDDKTFPVDAGDVILVDSGEYHRVYNDSDLGLHFVCVFNGGRNH